MKQTILQFTIFLFTIIWLIPANAQVTITQSDFPRPTEFTDSVYRSLPAIIPLPQEGPNQTWDYSGLNKDELFEIEYFNADNYEFPEALNAHIADLTFQGFIIEADSYENLDSDGWYNYARSTFDVSYPITSITGGPNDVLRFPEINDIYSGRVNLLKFPMTYQDQWTESRVETIPFELTVAAFGLDQTPGERRRTVTNHRDVVGHGDLILPDENDLATAPMNGLMIKVLETRVDSFFLGGAPAPTALLDAFGLTQGSIFEYTRYLFYKKDFGAPVFSQEIGADVVFYRPQAEATISSLKDFQLTNISYFPNPASAGEMINITLEEPIGEGSVRFYDVMGRYIFEERLDDGFGKELQFELPEAMETGIYFYHILNANGIVIGLEKLQLI